jgi:outer membrane receptor protein involved in Fe transport
VNEFRIGYNRFFYTATSLSGGVNLGAQAGIPGIPSFGSFTNGLPTIAITGISSIGDALLSPRGQNVRQVLDNVSFTTGAHSFKFGFDHRRTEFNVRQGSSSEGSFSYTGVYTNDPTTRAGGQAFADFLLGYPQSASIGTPLDLGSRVHNYSAFAQDDWHPNSRLTLNLGVRYEFTTPVCDVNNRLANFNPAINNLSSPNPAESRTAPRCMRITTTSHRAWASLTRWVSRPSCEPDTGCSIRWRMLDITSGRRILHSRSEPPFKAIKSRRVPRPDRRSGSRRSMPGI